LAANPQWRNGLDDKGDSAGLAQVDADALWEKKVMDRVVARDDAAMMLLYDRYSSLVFSVAMHVLSDQNLAEDVAQEVFLKIWRSPGTFDPNRGSLAGWLAVMTRHRAIDILRKRRRECSVAIEELRDSKFQGQMEDSEMATKIAALFPSMPAPQRVALGLAYFCGLTHSEISLRTGEPLGTVKSRIRLALEFLRRVLANPEGLKYSVPIDPTPLKERK
jgi:RNA polymerase sigma-70 factor, ECF subfamily